MSQRQTITINNYFYIPLQKYKELINSKQYSLNEKDIFNNVNQNIFPIKKDNFECKIVKQEQLIFSMNNKENKKDENIIMQDKSKELIIEIKEQKPKFLTDNKVYKIKGFKTIGRKPKNSLIKSYHTKFSHDNILRKIKVKFFKKL